MILLLIPDQVRDFNDLMEYLERVMTRESFKKLFDLLCQHFDEVTAAVSAPASECAA